MSGKPVSKKIRFALAFALVPLVLTACENESGASKFSSASLSATFLTCTSTNPGAPLATHDQFNVNPRDMTVDLAGNTFVSGFVTRLELPPQDQTYALFITKYDSCGIRQWTIETGGGKNVLDATLGQGIATDSLGNAYSVGYTSTNLDGIPKIGNKSLFVTKYNTNGTRQWTVLNGGSLPNCGALPGGANEGCITEGWGVATDSKDNLYVTGETNIPLNGQQLHGKLDMFIVKYNKDGVRQWTVQDGAMGDGGVGGDKITVDPSGNVYVVGNTFVSLDGQPYKKDGYQNYFLTKYDENGNRQWTVQDGPSTYSADVGHMAGISLDSAGNVYITGTTKGSMNGQTMNGYSDYFVVKYSPDGVRQWTMQEGAPKTSVTAGGVVVGADGSIYVTATTNNGTYGREEHFLTKFKSDRSKLWTTLTGNFGSANTYALTPTLDQAGNVSWLSGNWDGQQFQVDLLLTKHDSNGVLLWESFESGAK